MKDWSKDWLEEKVGSSSDDEDTNDEYDEDHQEDDQPWRIGSCCAFGASEDSGSSLERVESRKLLEFNEDAISSTVDVSLGEAVGSQPVEFRRSEPHKVVVWNLNEGDRGVATRSFDDLEPVTTIDSLGEDDIATTLCPGIDPFTDLHGVTAEH